MDPMHSSEMSVNFYWNNQRHIQKRSHIRSSWIWRLGIDHCIRLKIRVLILSVRTSHSFIRYCEDIWIIRMNCMRTSENFVVRSPLFARIQEIMFLMLLMFHISFFTWNSTYPHYRLKHGTLLLSAECKIICLFDPYKWLLSYSVLHNQPSKL